jgi:hypothetical protein
MLHGETTHVQFVDDHVVPVDTRRAVFAPGEGAVDDAAFRHAGGVVAAIERQVRVAVADAVTEMGVAPAQCAGDVLPVWV